MKILSYEGIDLFKYEDQFFNDHFFTKEPIFEGNKCFHIVSDDKDIAINKFKIHVKNMKPHVNKNNYMFGCYI